VSLIKNVTLQKIVAHNFQYDPLTTLCMVCDIHVNGIKGPVTKGRECHVIRVDWVHSRDSNSLEKQKATWLCVCPLCEGHF
jgi:hypothetical protein